MTTLTGGCHCRNILVTFKTEILPAAFEPRACQCSFCRQHQSRAVSDAAGHLAITVARADDLSRYRFGLKTIEFLVCRTCGVYVAGFMADPTDEAGYATLMVSALDERAAFPLAVAKSYDDQNAAARTSRRRKGWTPARLQVG